MDNKMLVSIIMWTTPAQAGDFVSNGRLTVIE